MGNTTKNLFLSRSSATTNLSCPRTLAERFFPSLRFVQNDIPLASFFKLNHYRRLVRLDKIRDWWIVREIFWPVGCVDPEIHGQGVAVHSIVRPEGRVDYHWWPASAVALRGPSMSIVASCPGPTLRSLLLSSFAGSLSCRHRASANGARRCTFQPGFGSRPPVDVSRLPYRREAAENRAACHSASWAS
jgi:hypothetical protein